MSDVSPLQLYKTLTGVSSHFIGDFILDEAIDQSLAELGQLTSADRTYMYRFHHKAKLVHITHEWLSDAIPDMQGSTTSISTPKKRVRESNQTTPPWE